jgi:hypothetical protein
MSTTEPGRNEPVDDDSIAQPFDQTNGMMDEGGDSDGTAASDTASAAERRDGDVQGGPTTDDGGAEPTQGDRGLAGGAAGLAVHRGG